MSFAARRRSRPTSSNGIAQTTGPKISSRTTFMSGSGVGEHGRLARSSRGRRSRLPPSTACAPPRAPDFEVAETLRELLLGDQRAHLRSSGSVPGPTLIAWRPARRRPRRPRRRPASATNSREPALQHCPWLKKIAFAAPGIAASRSASAKTMFGDLPPSSSVTFFRLPAAACTISLPTSVEPVNATLSTSGCAASAAPASRRSR